MSSSDIDVLLGAAPQRRIAYWGGVAVLVVALVVAFLLFERFLNAPASPWFSTPVEQGDLAPVIHVDATLLARNATVLPAVQDGFVRDVAGPAFKPVAKGEALVRFDARVVASGVAQARAALKAARSAADEAQFARAEAGVRLARFESVWRKSNGRVPSLDEMENARLNVRRAATAIDDAQARAAAVELQLASARDRARGAVLRAPFAGVIVARHVEPGQFVRMGAPLMTLGDSLDHMLVGTNLDRATTDLLPDAFDATMLVSDLPRVVRKVRLVRLPPGHADGWQASFALDSSEQTLHPGAQVQLDIPLPLHHAVLVVPNAALDFAPAGSAHADNTIYVLGKDGQLRRVHVSVRGSDRRQTEVSGQELRAGLDVVTGSRETPDKAKP